MPYRRAQMEYRDRGRKYNTSPGQHGGPAKPPAHMHEHMEQMHYPLRKSALIRAARTQNMPADVVRVLRRLPDHEYQNADHVCRVAVEVHEV
ncbi:MAG: DUF2795 domain-containing protein [Phycisphaerae bacterium]|nr:DUF2795 domain-containing protein [Phycisphaerae bacterium]